MFRLRQIMGTCERRDNDNKQNKNRDDQAQARKKPTKYPYAPEGGHNAYAPGKPRKTWAEKLSPDNTEPKRQGTHNNEVHISLQLVTAGRTSPIERCTGRRNSDQEQAVTTVVNLD